MNRRLTPAVSRLTATVRRKYGRSQLENIRTRDGDEFEIQPCPPWCTGGHFPAGEQVDSDDGFHHYGPDVSVPTSHRPFTDQDSSTVRLCLKAWVHPLDADTGTGCVDVTLFTADGEPTIELTPAEARAIATALVMLVDTAEQGRHESA